MISVEEAQKLILENTKVLESVEVSLIEAERLVLAEDIISPLNLPYFTNSAMDGYAVKSRDTEEANESSPVSLKVIGVIRAGSYPNFAVGDKEAVKIMTGAPLPERADSVVMVEYTEEEGGIVKVKKAVNPSENVRYEGEEIKKGEIALEKGTELNPASVGFIAEFGIKKVRVYRKTKDALKNLGVEGIFSRVAQRPGGPMFFGKCDETLIFGLPGNPASALVCFYE